MAVLRCIVAFFVSAMLVSSCAGDNEFVQSKLAAADSLLNVDPQQSLDVICDLDTSATLNRREKAYRDYLLVSAKFKCYYSVANDTVIFSAADYFRRHGPEEYYGKALMMQGAVQFEQNLLKDALETYKLSESVFEETGSYLELGLLNARIGEVYRVSFVNDSASVDRFGKAVRYFKLSGDKKRISASLLDYARSVMPDSLDLANEMILGGLEISREIRDTSLMLYAHELLAYLESYRNDHFKFIELANELLSEIERNDLESLSENTCNNIYFKLSDTYVELGMPTEASESLSNVIISSDTDSLLYYYAKERIAELEGNWQEAHRYLERSGELYGNIVSANYDERLVEAELQYELVHARSEFQKRQNRSLVLIIFLLAAASILSIIILIAVNRLKDKKRESRDYADKLILAEKELNDLVQYQRSLGDRIENQHKGNMELQELSCQLMKTINDIGYTYEIEKDSTDPARLVKHIRKQIDRSMSQQAFEDKARRVVDILYPGMLEGLFSAADPMLTDEEKWIVILMCCNFETNTICVFTGNSVTQLNNKKSRLGKKLNLNERLSSYLKAKMQEYSH